VAQFKNSLQSSMTLDEILSVLCYANEYEELPVRHNEDLMNADLAKNCPINVEEKCMPMESPHTKTHLLLQAHFSRLQLPCSDYSTDLKSVLDQAIRIIQAMIDVAAESGWLATTLKIQNLLQMVVQGRWITESSLLCLPHIEPYMVKLLVAETRNRVECLPELIAYCKGQYETLARHLRSELEEQAIEDIFEVISRVPQLEISAFLLNCETANNEHENIRDDEKSQKITVDLGPHPHKDSGWIKVKSDTDYTLCLQLHQFSSATNKKKNQINVASGKAYAPRFPKPKDEGWFLLLGDLESQDLLALKRLGGLKSSGANNHQLTFTTPFIDSPEVMGHQIGSLTGGYSKRIILTLYIISDAYLGLDQQYDLKLEVINH